MECYVILETSELRSVTLWLPDKKSIEFDVRVEIYEITD